MRYAIEEPKDVEDELAELIGLAWEESQYSKDICNLSYDIEEYQEHSDNGNLKLYTVRDKGRLVGFASVVISHSLHSQGCLTAATDVIFILKECRGFGAYFLKAITEDLREEGVKLFALVLKTNKDTGSLAKAIGYDFTETIYYKEL